jgi:hypothetical protein
MSIDVSEFETNEKPDFARANGAPMVMIDGKRERYSRPSGFAKPLDDESALTNWRIDTACFGVAGDKALQARYVAAKRDDRTTVAALREAAIQAGRGEQAADVGTAIHSMSERWEDPDDDFQPPDPYLSALRAYTLEMTRLGLVSERMECAFVTTEYRTAGTADRIYRLTRPLVVPTGEILPAGTLVIGDLKTSKTLEYSMGGFAAQLSLYAQGKLYDVVNDELLDTPEINQDWGVIAWIPSNQEAGHCEMIWVDLNAGNHAAWLAHMVKEYRKQWRRAEPVRVPDPLEPSVEEVVAVLEDELGATPADADALVEWIRLRIASIKANADAMIYLTRWWPEGVPTPKGGLSDPAQIETVLTLLDKTEAEFGMTWPIGDPRASTPNTKKQTTKEKK